MTPTISVEPIGDRVGLWHLAAALGSPPIAARALRDHLGAGRSSGALRWSAGAVLDTPVPLDEPSWDRGAALCRRLHDDPAGGVDPGSDETDRWALLEEFGAVMSTAYGLAEDHPVVRWWCLRLPRR